MKIIVTTTINPPTTALQKFSQIDDWKLIVVGDLKTPHDLFKEINCIYLHPDEQKKKYPEVSEAIGWNKIQRRNIGFIEAYHLGASVIASVDDDNIPYDNWGKDILLDKETEVDWWKADTVFDPLSVTKHNHIWHRGFPLQLVHKRTNNYLGKKTIVPLVQADLWNGDPDVDSIERIVWIAWRQKWRPIDFGKISPYSTPNITPFNSQNTFLSRKVFPYYSCLPFIGRMDDIWGAYMMQKHIGVGQIVFNNPSVYQARNEHDFVNDMKNEVIGLNSLDYIFDKYELPDDTKRFVDVYRNSF